MRSGKYCLRRSENGLRALLNTSEALRYQDSRQSLSSTLWLVLRALTHRVPPFPLCRSSGIVMPPYRPDLMHWFCKPSPTLRTHHLHLVPFQNRLWIERLAFRDYLPTHPDVALQYANLKHRLAEQYRFDREAYTEAKSEFVGRVVELALRGKTATHL
jgi:GrpB-like predicted nucleotidyltransferase (UPF0157 family)